MLLVLLIVLLKLLANCVTCLFDSLLCVYLLFVSAIVWFLVYFYHGWLYITAKSKKLIKIL